LDRTWREDVEDQSHFSDGSAADRSDPFNLRRGKLYSEEVTSDESVDFTVDPGSNGSQRRHTRVRQQDAGGGIRCLS
jgi:hypothetical protein